MHIWVDADACPQAVKSVLFRAAERRGARVTLVANQPLSVPRLERVTTLQVPRGFDEADNEIVKRMAAGDLVVTQDIPLASAVIEAGGLAINPRGEHYTEDSIGQRLAMRNFLDELRSSGVQTGGPDAWNARDTQRFADALDRILTSNGL